MRSAQKNNRSRGRGNRKGSGGGGGGNVVNRVYDSAGPEGKVRGTPQQIIDKYLSLARDAQTSGDRVVSENFLQHAEHYQRMLIQAAAMQEQSRRDSADAATDFDGDGEGDGDGPDAGPRQSERRAPPQPRHEQPRHETGGTGPERSGAEGSDVERSGADRSGADRSGGDRSGGDEIGGMTMIDSGREGEDLLVVSEDITQSQPRRNGDGRRRRPKPSSGDAEGEKQPTPEAQPRSDS